MSTPTFAETHNLVSFLEKPYESEGFEQIIDFLNSKPIIYALMVNPTVYASCVKQFWATAKVKKVNGQEQIQALVDKQKVIITEESIRRDLKFSDAEGTVCLPNDTIFAELERMGYEKPSQKLTFYRAFFSPQWKFLILTILQYLMAKTTAWNEFSSTMASAIIYLANNQKFHFPIEGIAKPKEIYVMSSYNKKIFANMRRQGQGFSVTVTLLFETMMVNAQEEVGKGLGIHIDSHPTPTNTQPSSSKPNKKMKPKRKQRQAAKVHSPSSEIPVEESILTPSNNPLPSGEDSFQLNELMIFCTNLQQQEKDSLGAQEDASKQGRSIEDIDQDVETALVDESYGRMHDADMFGVDDLEGNEVFVDARKKSVEKEVSTADLVTTAGEVVFAASVEDSVAPTTATTTDVDDELTLDKGKAKMIEPEKPLKNKDQIALDEEVARKLEAKMRADPVPSYEEEGLGDQEDASKQGRIAEIDVDDDLSLINKTTQDQGRMNDEDLFGVNDLDGDEVIVDIIAGENVEQDATVAEKEVSVAADEVVTTAESVEGITVATTLQISKDDVTLAQTLIEIKAAKPRSRGVIVQEPCEVRTTLSLQPSQPLQAKDKDKGIMVEPKKPLKKKNQIAFDEEVARKLEA
nr:xylulose kinase-1 [Tanacetum cinerariifolium]